MNEFILRWKFENGNLVVRFPLFAEYAKRGKKLEKESEIQKLSKTPLTLAHTVHRSAARLPAAPSDPPMCFGTSLKKHHGVG